MSEAEEIAALLRHLVPEASITGLGITGLGIVVATLAGRMASIHPVIITSSGTWLGCRAFLYSAGGDLASDNTSITAFMAAQVAAAWLAPLTALP